MPSVTLNYLYGEKDRKKFSGITADEYLLVGEYIFETFYEPIDDKSYDSENDCGTDKQHEFLRKNEHGMTPSFRIITKINMYKFYCQQNLREISDKSPEYSYTQFGNSFRRQAGRGGFLPI